jgi:hypothetical protein
MRVIRHVSLGAHFIYFYLFFSTVTYGVIMTITIIIIIIIIIC